LAKNGNLDLNDAIYNQKNITADISFQETCNFFGKLWSIAENWSQHLPLLNEVPSFTYFL
jgi:hypothetical protein